MSPRRTDQASHGAIAPPAGVFEKLATSITSPRSRGSSRQSWSDHTSGSSSDVLAQAPSSSVVASRTNLMRKRLALDRVAGRTQRAVHLGGEARQRLEQRVALEP